VHVVEPKQDRLCRSESVGLALPVRQWSSYAREAILSFRANARTIDRLVVSVDSESEDVERYRGLVIEDERISVVKTDEHLSMAGHYEFCVAQLQTKWVTVLGQDDALHFNFGSEVTHAIAYANRLDLGAISFRRAYFNWNDGTSDLLGYAVKYATYGRPHVVRSGPLVIRGLLGLREHFDFPQIYTNNLVRKDTIDCIRQSQSGRVFLEPIPDTYSGVAVARTLEKFLAWPVPVFWTGSSKMSAGLAISASVVIPQHIVLANSEGRFFSVPQNLWVDSENSAIFTLSALLSINQRSQSLFVNRLMILATVSALFANELASCFRNGIPRPKSTNFVLGRTEVVNGSGFDSLFSIVVGVLLMPIQLMSRGLRSLRFLLGTKGRRGLRLRNRYEFTTPNDLNANFDSRYRTIHSHEQTH